MKLAAVDIPVLAMAAAPATAPAATDAPRTSPTTGTNANSIATKRAKPNRMDLVAMSWFTGFVKVCVNSRFSEAI